MPEGDTIYRAASRLAPALDGEEVIEVWGSHRAVREYGRRLVGRTVERVSNRGKHLLIEFSGDWVARSHMKMTGRWDVYEQGSRWRRERGAARLVVETAGKVAVCFAAPDIEILPRHLIEERLAYLGPDLTAESFDEAQALRRLTQSDAATIADLLLDQGVMAGIGNVFKSELAFLVARSPAADPSTLTDDEAQLLVSEARRLLMLNRDRADRVTTGDDRRPLYAYGRDGQGCRRCRGRLRSAKLGDPPRVTYWCPDCQL